MTARPTLALVREGNPGHRTKAELARGLKLPPNAPPEPDWALLFPARPVFVPRRKKAETEEERGRREAALLERDVAKDDAEVSRRLASEAWTHVVRVLDAQGLLATLDWVVLEELGIVRARIVEAERDVSRHGLRQLGERGWTRNGSITTATQYRAQLRWLCDQLGLSPAARDGLGAPPPPGGADGEAEGADDFDV